LIDENTKIVKIRGLKTEKSANSQVGCAERQRLMISCSPVSYAVSQVRNIHSCYSLAVALSNTSENVADLTILCFLKNETFCSQ